MTITIEPTINVYAREEYRERLRLVRDIAELVQIDVIDGIFAKPMNFSDVATTARVLPGRRVHVHLMVEDIAASAERWIPLVPRRITCHVEVAQSLPTFFGRLREAKIERGLALRPQTSLDRIAPYLPDIDFLLFVSVPPGPSGQAFDPHTIERVRTIHARYPQLPIGVDGGVTGPLIAPLIDAGATSLSFGSAIFTAPDPQEALREYQRLARESVRAARPARV